MIRLDSAPEIVKLASELGLEWRTRPVKNIVDFCLMKIRQWTKNSSPIASIAALQELACQQLSLVFEEIWEDADLDRIIRKYVNLGELGFAMLKNDFDAKTYATLMERHNITCDAHDRYVAVIDCRGEKAFRRFFTRWHEIAHLLTLVRQLELPFVRHRSRDDNSPTERMMDRIASEVGFYEPIFKPLVAAAMINADRFTFGVADGIRFHYAPEASSQATLFAAMRHWSKPIIYLEAGMGLKKHEEDLLNSPQMNLLPMAPPAAKLRVLSVNQNDPAKDQGFRIDRNMTVPPSSLIARYHDSPEITPSESVEDLTEWKHSDGRAVGSGLVHVETRHHDGRVVALVQPD